MNIAIIPLNFTQIPYFPFSKSKVNKEYRIITPPFSLKFSSPSSFPLQFSQYRPLPKTLSTVLLQFKQLAFAIWILSRFSLLVS
jgi:hypothetical protein